MQILSGTATTASKFVDAVAGTRARILDTRKTIPGMRLAQKYAVACGGATNHRTGLFDAIMLKENHIAAMGSMSAAIKRCRTSPENLLVEIEVETLGQLEQALDSRANRLMLDNFSLEMLRDAVRLRQAKGSNVEFEASGGVTLESVRDIAETGVDFISVGIMTKSVKAIDFSLRIV